MLLADLVAASKDVAATSSRKAKIAALAALLRRLEPPEVQTAVCFLTGEPRQGRIGVGWATVARADVPPAEEPSLTVLEVDTLLGEIQKTGGSGSAARRTTLLRDLFSRTTSAEADFVRRLFGGELRQGALAGVMADAIAAAAAVPAAAVRRAAMLSGDLGWTATTAMNDGPPGLEATRLHVMRPVLPMLAATSPDVETALAALGESSVEWKLDGARIQVHRDGTRVGVYTRNLNDVTHRLPEVVAAALTIPVDRFVLDGETLALDVDERPALFQATMSRFGQDVAPPGGLRPFFFDVLHAGGTDFLDRALRERLDVLEAIAGRWRIPSIQTSEPAAAEQFLGGAIAAGHEGIMLKALDSPYAAGRRGATWQKVKPVATLDLVVLAAEWGHGRRAGWLSNLHLGARDPAGGFVMVGKTFKGLTDELLTWQTARFQELETGRHGIAVVVRPEQVVEIALDGVQASTRYPGGVALRFARVRRYRDDKAAAEADTIDTVRALLPRA